LTPSKALAFETSIHAGYLKKSCERPLQFLIEQIDRLENDRLSALPGASGVSKHVRRGY
jgi:hypothetical protein